MRGYVVSLMTSIAWTLSSFYSNSALRAIVTMTRSRRNLRSTKTTSSRSTRLSVVRRWTVKTGASGETKHGPKLGKRVRKNEKDVMCEPTDHHTVLPMARGELHFSCSRQKLKSVVPQTPLHHLFTNLIVPSQCPVKTLVKICNFSIIKREATWHYLSLSVVFFYTTSWPIWQQNQSNANCRHPICHTSEIGENNQNLVAFLANSRTIENATKIQEISLKSNSSLSAFQSSELFVAGSTNSSNFSEPPIPNAGVVGPSHVTPLCHFRLIVTSSLQENALTSLIFTK